MQGEQDSAARTAARWHCDLLAENYSVIVVIVNNSFDYPLVQTYFSLVIDDTDRKLLDLLQCNAHMSNADMAAQVGLTVSSVHERVKKMERKGIIKGYVAVVDPEKLGKQLLAFQRLTVTPNSHAKSDIEALCAKNPDILECHNVAGEDCLILKLRATGPKELEKLLSAIRASADATRSVTNIVFSSYKESTRIVPAPADEGD